MKTDICRILQEHDAYKYLGLLEDIWWLVTIENMIKIKEGICLRIKKLCEGNLNGVNLFKAINEQVISVLNFHIGLLEYEENELRELDDGIRKILRENKVHIRTANNQRLYMNREKLGCG